MQIRIAESAGFCFGVSRAVDKAMTAPEGTVTFGEIIHNKIVVERLKERGVSVADTIEDCKGKNVILRSHGVGRDVMEKIKAVAKSVTDATCPFVSKIHQIVEEKHREGYLIVIIGEKHHAEVVGTNGWCDYSATVISDEKEAEGRFNKEDKLAVVCQTTFSVEKSKKIYLTLKNQCKIVEFFNTICYTTKGRQQEAVDLAKSCDAVLVLGGAHSSNTDKLYRVCQEYCDNVYLITSVSDLSKVVNNNIQRLGITAGASTPNELIEEVANIMESQERTTEFEQAMAQQKEVKIRAGQKLEVTVINADENGISVSFGGKTDAFIERAEVEIDEADYKPENYPTGMTFVAEFIEKKGKGEMIAMSKKRIDIRAKEAKECEEILKGSEFKVKIEKAVNGGLLSKLGPYTIFVPQSHVKMGFEKDLAKYVGKEMRLRVIPAKKDEAKEGEDKKMSKRIVASHRVLIEEEKAAKEEAFWSSMIVGSVVKGKVKRFTDFGAFVSVNGNDCLAHISDLSWVKVDKPGDVLEINNTYEFVILNADRETGKVSLGYKQLQKKPYEEAAEKFPVGTVVKGKVERIFSYGAFVSIDKGIDGLVPVSEISHSYVKDATEAFTQGQEIEAKVIKFDGSKITLSVKALLPAPEKLEEVEINEEDYQEAKEKRAKANARKFDVTAATAPKKPRAKRPAQEKEEIKSWTSESSSATFADLFKGLDLNLSDENK